jgi:hypothetical protein
MPKWRTTLLSWESCAKVNPNPFGIVRKLGQSANILEPPKCVCCQDLIHANKDDFETLVITAVGDDFSSSSDTTQYLRLLLRSCRRDVKYSTIEDAIYRVKSSFRLKY